MQKKRGANAVDSKYETCINPHHIAFHLSITRLFSDYLAEDAGVFFFVVFLAGFFFTAFFFTTGVVLPEALEDLATPDSSSLKSASPSASEESILLESSTTEESVAPGVATSSEESALPPATDLTVKPPCTAAKLAGEVDGHKLAVRRQVVSLEGDIALVDPEYFTQWDGTPNAPRRGELVTLGAYDESDQTFHRKSRSVLVLNKIGQDLTEGELPKLEEIPKESEKQGLFSLTSEGRNARRKVQFEFLNGGFYLSLIHISEPTRPY